MNDLLKEKCDLLVSNKNVLEVVGKWDSVYMVTSAAIMFADVNRAITEEEVKNTAELIKSKSKMFSDFRGEAKLPLLAKMILNGDQEKYFEEVESVYGMFGKKKWTLGVDKIMAAISIVDHVDDPARYQEYVDRTLEIYERMKDKHPFLTNDEDIPFAAMLAVANSDVDKMIEEMELSYNLLKGKFFESNAVQSISHILCLYEGDAKEKASKVIELNEALKKRKHSFGMFMHVAILGSLAMLDDSIDNIADMICETDDYLKTFKGFGSFVFGDDMRRVYAAQLVLDAYTDNKESGEDNIGTVLGVTITMEICIMLCMVSAVAAVSSVD